MERKPERNIIKNIRFVFSYIFKYDKIILLLYLWTIPSTVLARMIGSLFSKYLIDAVVAQSVGIMITVILIFAGGRLLLNMGSAYTQSQLKFRNYRLKSKYIESYINRCMRMDYESLELVETKDQAQRTVNQFFSTNYWSSQSIDSYPALLVSIISSLLGITVYTGIISMLHPLIAVFLSILALTSYWMQKHLARKRHNDKEQAIPIERKINYIQREAGNFASVKDIRLYSISGWLTEVFDEQFRKWKSIWHARSRLNAFFAIVLECMNSLLKLGIYVFLFCEFYQDRIGASDFVLYLGLITGFSAWVLSLVKNVERLFSLSYDINDVRQFLEVGVPEEHAEAPSPERSDIVFDNVSFSYNKENFHPVIDHLSFNIKPCEKIGIVGLNGSGKTTLIKLLCGLYLPDEGKITLCGADTAKTKGDDLYRIISPVFQDIYLLPTSIGRNITLSPEMDESKLDECIRQADLEECIETLPCGKETNVIKSVREDAIELSGGQVQRIALARALYKNSRILILDEPTSALDPIAEHRLYEKYAELTKGRTAVFVSHRLASTRFCDRLFYMENGKIVECGSHSELIALGGKYAAMYELQSQYYREGEEQND